MKRISIILTLFVVVGCTVVVRTVNGNKKTNDVKKDSDLSEYANEYFWSNFHEGNYSNIDSVVYYLTSAYIENPNHLETVTHLGFTHMWALSEMNNLDTIPPTIIDHGTLALKYFGESYRLNPDDPRVLGFLAASKMTVADLSDDKKLSTEGYFNGKKSIHQWKEFNKLTIGYVMSQMHQDTWEYKKALKWQWETLDECYCQTYNEKTKRVEQYRTVRDTAGNLKNKRACWDSWIVPHNVEGFYLNLGDMLVKNGEWEKAKQVYTLAKKAPNYETWPFKSVLEKRIISAEENVEKFRLPIGDDTEYHVDDVMLINSSISCVACHKMSSQDLATYRNFDWKKYKGENNIYWMNK